MSLRHWVPSVIASLWFAAPAATTGSGVVDFVQKNCIACHNSKAKAGDLDLASQLGERTFDANRGMWEKVLDRLKTGQMPPPAIPRPAAGDVTAATRALETEFARQDRLLKPAAGRVTARRLNRAEYNNTIRDLLGVDIRPADAFPADDSAFGFDNISDALNLSPALLEKYVDAAERVVRTAIFGPERLKPSMIHYPTPVRINDSRGRSSLPKDLFHYDLTGLSTLHSAHIIHRFPVDAEYSFRLVLNGHRPNQSEPVHPALYIDGKLVQQWEYDATDLEGQIVEGRARVTAGEHLLSATYLKTYHGLPPSYHGPEPSKRPPVALISTRGKLTEQDIETLRKYGTKIKTDSIETRVDNRFESIDVGGPFHQVTAPSPESLRKVFVCGHAPGKHTDACARTIVTSFAGRAFRRPADTKEVERFLGLVTLARKQGDTFEEGIAAALEAILVSPNFLYRIERDRAAKDGRSSLPVSDYELASRLSYFLWSSTPDDELLRLAAARRLRQPGVLHAQVRRMLLDRKSDALVENFAGQWLQFKNIDVMRPDQQRFPVFDDGLRQAMRRETEMFLEYVVRENRSVLELLDAGYTFLNERLARFYGVSGVTGPEFRRVDMSGTTRGGGILSQASILTVSSYSTRTSPVLRGKWILENILNAPPPPPPAAVPALDDTKAGQTGTLRQQMEEHRKNPACASCHSRMDPLGFGLENFNAIGEWRTEDGKFPIDSSGLLPDGGSFQTPAGLKALLLKDREAFVKGLTEKLLTYALGRGLERYDRPTVNAIAAKLPSRNYRFQDLVLEVVDSLPFQMRQTAGNSQIARNSKGDSK
jgi:mono/diheme cytochrome c family protein